MTLFQKLPAEQVSGSARAVTSLGRIAEASTLSAEIAQVGHVFHQVERVKNRGAVNSQHKRNCPHSFHPISSSLRSVEGCKYNVRRKPLCPMNDRPHGNFVSRIFITKTNPASCVNFTVKVKAGKIFGKVLRNLDFVSSASPKEFSVPVSPAPVQLFRCKPTHKRRLPNPILGQSHLGFVKHKDIISSLVKM